MRRGYLRRWGTWSTLVCAAAGACLLPAAGGAGGGGSVPAAPGTVSASVTGPETVTINNCCVPPRIGYRVTMTYTGPAPSPSVHTRFDLRLPTQVSNPGIPAGGPIDSCTMPGGVPGPVVSCDAFFTEAARTVSIEVTARPTGGDGVGTATLELSTGAGATATTTFVRERAAEPPPPPPPASPPPIPGAAVAPTKTIVETLTREGQAEPQSVPVSPRAQTVQIALTWADPDSRLNVVGIQLVPLRAPTEYAGALALGPDAKPPKLRIKRTATPRSLNVTVKNVRRGRLRFKIVAVKLDGATRVTAKVRQSRR